MKNQHPIIKQLLESGIDVAMSYDNATQTLKYKVDGFYKSDSVTLTIESDTSLLATARYNEKTIINDLRDIVQLNWSWYCDSKDRFSGWSMPDSRWLELLKNFDFIK